MALVDELTEIERELAMGGADAYRRHLRDDATVIVPGARLSAADTVAAMERSAGWDRADIDEARAIALGSGAALLTYRFRGRRGKGAGYAAEMTSVYVRADGGWRLVLHQQTPLESAG